MARSPLVTTCDLFISEMLTGRTLLKEINLSVFAGETIAILGESGAGKTLLGRALADALPANIRVRSAENATRSAITKEQHARITLIPQSPSLPPLLPIGRFVAAVAEWSAPPGAAEELACRVQELLNLVSFPTDRASRNKRPFQLSGGQIQRVAVAAALATRPSLLILDEPTVGLDPLLRSDLCRLLVDLNRAHGVSLLMTSHDIRAAAEVTDRALVLRDGGIIAQGEWKSLLTNPDPYVRELLATLDTDYLSRRRKTSPPSDPVREGEDL